MFVVAFVAVFVVVMLVCLWLCVGPESKQKGERQPGRNNRSSKKGNTRKPNHKQRAQELGLGRILGGRGRSTTRV